MACFRKCLDIRVRKLRGVEHSKHAERPSDLKNEKMTFQGQKGQEQVEDSKKEINADEKSRNRVYVAEVYYNIGLVYLAADQTSLAKKWLEKSLEVNISETGEMNLGVAKIYEVLALVFENMKLTHDAIVRQKR